VHDDDLGRLETNEKPANPAPMWPVTSMRANSDAATPKAMTNVRSNSSSNGVATRCGW
jgi:hypothetical protein